MIGLEYTGVAKARFAGLNSAGVPSGSQPFESSRARWCATSRRIAAGRRA